MKCSVGRVRVIARQPASLLIMVVGRRVRNATPT